MIKLASQLREGSYHVSSFSANTQAEIRRLDAQVDLFWSSERELIVRYGLKDGMNYLDCGCGPGRLIELLKDSLPALAQSVTEAPCVLVVDDSPSVRRVVCTFLERAGWQTVDAKDGIDALEKLGSARADVALVDIEMPRMNGYELLARIKSDANLRRIPVVFLTSRSAAKHRERAIQLQVDGYLVKPYRENELLEELTRVIRG